jgi:predicted nucleotidyltransferase
MSSSGPEARPPATGEDTARGETTTSTSMPRPLVQDPASDLSDASGKVAALAFTRGVAASWSAQCGARVLGVYLIGSLAHGGFSLRYSDLDVALVMDEVDTSAIDKMRRIASADSCELAAKLSLFWTDRRFASGRFPLLDRVDYLDHAVVLVERERVVPARPSLHEIRSYLCGTPFSDWAALARHFATLDVLTAEDSRRYLRTLLYPARFIFSWMTGGVASNDDAVAFLSVRAPARLDVALIARALACRRSGADPIQLFADRRGLLRQVEACEYLVDCS